MKEEERSVKKRKRGQDQEERVSEKRKQKKEKQTQSQKKGKRREPGDEATVTLAEGATPTTHNWSIPRAELREWPWPKTREPPHTSYPRPN